MAPVQPLPVNKTLSLSDALTALRIMSLMKHTHTHQYMWCGTDLSGTCLASSLKCVDCLDVKEVEVCVFP